MTRINATWDNFKADASTYLKKTRAYIFRGHANAHWVLSTTVHRSGLISNHQELLSYFDSVLPFVQELVETWDGSRRDLDNGSDLLQFLAFLQHHGFPTPLLDWTYSPYIATYFAFEGINHFNPQYEKVAIYAFHREAWLKEYQQTYDWKIEKPHVTPMSPTYRGNAKQMLQQGTFLFSNQINIEGHIRQHERTPDEFMIKYEISVKERTQVLRELNAMNITPMQLAPSMESVCKKAYEEICSCFQIGLNPEELKALIESMIANREIQPKPENDARD